MEQGRSTRGIAWNGFARNEYIWTTYEWLLLDPKREIQALAEFLRLDVSAATITNAAGRVGRGPGGNNRGHRRGLMTEWASIFGEQLMAETAQLEERDWALAGRENDLASPV